MLSFGWCGVFVVLPNLAQDSCNAPDSLEDEPSSEAIVQYELFRDALKATGRPVYLALSGWHNWYSPYGQSLANSWRIGYDVRNWLSAWHLGGNRKKSWGPIFTKQLGGCPGWIWGIFSLASLGIIIGQTIIKSRICYEPIVSRKSSSCLMMPQGGSCHNDQPEEFFPNQHHLRGANMTIHLAPLRCSRNWLKLFFFGILPSSSSFLYICSTRGRVDRYLIY